ncbi:hypothetical protein IAQ61_000621 [Plenodomus lingam]|uniref:uncharacterized protein n=1 Tax=Leptosphaeria maculans TaxID=5022 RepID=UPI003318AB6D|nr:hypothetical protein IAQ61_000621 [Plenodomus lingam]
MVEFGVAHYDVLIHASAMISLHAWASKPFQLVSKTRKVLTEPAPLGLAARATYSRAIVSAPNIRTRHDWLAGSSLGRVAMPVSEMDSRVHFINALFPHLSATATLNSKETHHPNKHLRSTLPAPPARRFEDLTSTSTLTFIDPLIQKELYWTRINHERDFVDGPEGSPGDWCRG